MHDFIYLVVIGQQLYQLMRNLPRILFRRTPISNAHPSPCPGRSARWPLYAGVILAIWLSFYLYANSLSLPFIQEDSSHIRWLSWHNPIEPFFGAKGAPAYRPLGKSIIKVWYLLLGRHDRAWLRFHNIALNSLNIALTGVLATWLERGRRGYWTGGIAALLFGVLPFSYQAIPWINNFFYPLSNFLLLLMAAVYWQARLRGSNRLLAAAMLLCLLAPFEIEYGAVGCGLLLAVEAALWLQGQQPTPWLGGPALGLLMNSAFVLRWLTIPKMAYSFGLPTPERVMQISVYFLQGLSFPTSQLALPIMEGTALNDLASVAVIGLPSVALVLGYLLWQRGRPLLVMGLLWFSLVSLPSLVVLDFDYVINSPRLLYPPGPAIAWLWGALLASFFALERRRILGVGLGVVLMLAVLQPNGAFVRERMDYYHLVERPVHQLMAVARQEPVENELLVVNFPSWLAPRQRTFALGNHGIQLIPSYIDIQDLIYAHNDADHPARVVQFDNLRQFQPYYYGIRGRPTDYDGLRALLSSSGDVYLTEYGADQIDLTLAGRVTGVEPGELAVTFDNALALALEGVGDDAPAGRLALTLNWQLLQSIDRDLTVFVHLYNPAGALVAQADGYPLRGLSPFWMWPAGQTLQDRRTLLWPKEAPRGTYCVGVGVYNQADGQRLPAVNAAGVPLPYDTAIVLELDKNW